MPTRTTSSSSASQSQPQRNRRRRDEEEEEDEEEVNVTSEEEAQATQKGKMTEDELKKKSAKLIRLAFASEHNKRALKRADTNKIIPNPRLFPDVLAEAQKTLRKTFGMELVEIRPKWKLGDELAKSAETQTQTQATQSKKGKGRDRGNGLGDIAEEEDEEAEAETAGATQGKKKPKGKATGQYILRSTLPPELVERTARPNPIALERPVDDETPDSGALIDWENGDGTQTAHVALLGIRTIILCLIMVNGRVMSDEQLHVFLRKLSLERDTPLPYVSSTSPNRIPLTLDKYLDLLDRQLYLQKVRVAKQGTADGFTIEWRWGQREVEFSEKAAARFIEELMFHGRTDNEDDERRRGRGEENAATGVESIKMQRKRMRKNLERAVGGTLTGEA